ncbi:MAG: RdgB/HAM1 family non-canonical purine NTP pyrophosphatase [Patescibacteria group bacterium]
MTRKKLLIATRNKGKIESIKIKLGNLPLDLLSFDDLPCFSPDFDIEEPASTFEGNAIIKAIMAGNKAKCLTLSEDSGLEVDYLDGGPGVFTARYAQGTDKDRYNKLLKAMKDVPKSKRRAQFRAVITIYDPDTKKIRTCQGICRGLITNKPVGHNGFGYDPVFYYPGLDKTIAQMTVHEKLSVDHRGQAMEIAKKILRQKFL